MSNVGEADWGIPDEDDIQGVLVGEAVLNDPTTPEGKKWLQLKEHTEARNLEVETAQREYQAMMMGGYGLKHKRHETALSDWFWMVKPGNSRPVYIHKDDPFTECPASVIDAQVPKSQWEIEIDDQGRPVMRSNRYSRRPPSDSHLARPEFKVCGTTIDPTRPKVFLGTQDGREGIIINQWRPITLPAAPSVEEQDKVAAIAREWLEFIYPGRADYILDHWAHAYKRLEQKCNVSLVFGGAPGIGKDTLLSLAMHAFAADKRVSTVKTSDWCKGFNGFMKNPVVISNEFHIERTDQNYTRVKEDVKTYGAAPPHKISVEDKNMRRMEVLNIHRMYYTTNFESQFPRDPNDRRFLILRSTRTRFEAEEFMKEKFGDTDTQEWIDGGAGDAFVHFLLRRDISGFNAKRLPQDLVDQYDDTRKGFDIEPVIGAALDEISLTFGRWLFDSGKYSGDAESWPEDDMEVNQTHWPEIVSSQQLINSAAAWDSTLDGEDIKKSKGRRGWMDRLMIAAGYVPLLKPDSKAQWVGKKPRNGDFPGTKRVQTSGLYMRNELAAVLLKNSEKQTAANEFIDVLTDYYRTEMGIRNYVTCAEEPH